MHFTAWSAPSYEPNATSTAHTAMPIKIIGRQRITGFVDLDFWPGKPQQAGDRRFIWEWKIVPIMGKPRGDNASPRRVLYSAATFGTGGFNDRLK